MADPILHIKDGYFFEVPHALWPARYEALEDIPSHLTFLVADEAAYISGDRAFEHGRKARDLIRAKKAGEHYDEAEYKALLGEYNHALTGKILIPQPFPGLRLKNFYEPASGFGITKFMILELVVAVVLVAIFTQYAKQVKDGQVPKGRFWNLIDVFLTFLRDQVVKPAIGDHGYEKFLPFIYTLFFFILGCNLTGMVPWAGSPTGEFGVTAALAGITLMVTIISGVQVFGPVGFVLNQAPALGIRESGLMAPLLFVIKVLLLIIELLGLLIKHAVLSVRLLANMVAGHLVLTTIMGIAATAGTASLAAWAPQALAVILGSALLSVMELFVAFLQAYIFCFLASLFIGAAVHHH